MVRTSGSLSAWKITHLKYTLRRVQAVRPPLVSLWKRILQSLYLKYDCGGARILSIYVVTISSLLRLVHHLASLAGKGKLSNTYHDHGRDTNDF
jgi:hypothetical protein